MLPLLWIIDTEITKIGIVSYNWNGNHIKIIKIFFLKMFLFDYSDWETLWVRDTMR